MIPSLRVTRIAQVHGDRPRLALLDIAHRSPDRPHHRITLGRRGDVDSRLRHGNLRLRQSDVTEIRERLEPLPARRRRRLRGLRAERADVILAGAVVIEELMRLGGYLTLIVCTHGVRDGLLLREAFDGEGES